MAHPHSYSRRFHAGKKGRIGKTISHRPFKDGEECGDIAWGATLTMAMLRSYREEAGRLSSNSMDQEKSLPIRVKPEDIRMRVHKQLEKVFVLFLIDSSDSMAARRRLSVAKGAVLGLLRRAYQQRHAVAVVTFSDTSAKLALRPTSSVFLARKSLRSLRPEGATPMAAGVQKALQVLRNIEARREYSSKIVIVLSDGEANVPIHRDGDPHREVMILLRRMKKLAGQLIFIDSKRNIPGRRSEMYEMAKAVGGRYFSPDELTTGTILRAVNQAE